MVLSHFFQCYNYIIQIYIFPESRLAMRIKNLIMYAADSLIPLPGFRPQERSADVDKGLCTKVSLQHTLF